MCTENQANQGIACSKESVKGYNWYSEDWIKKTGFKTSAQYAPLTGNLAAWMRPMIS
jgi:hypothetical protein